MEKLQQKNEIFDEERMEHILQITDILTADGQKELALDLLLQTIRRCELDAQGGTESEQEKFDELRTQLEQKYKSVHKTKRYVSNVLMLHLIKTAITISVICIALLIGGLIAGRLVSRKVGNVEQQTVENIVEKIVDELRDEISKTEKVRLAGLTQNAAVHYKISLIKEEQGDLQGAIEEMELALGLLEPDKDAYKERLGQLQNKYRLGGSEKETSENDNL